MLGGWRSSPALHRGAGALALAVGALLACGASGALSAWDCGAALQKACPASERAGPDGALPVASSLRPFPAYVAGRPLWRRPRVGPRVGFNEVSVGAGYLKPPGAAALASGIGARLVRIPLNWAYTVGRHGGAPDWRSWDARYRAYVAAGIRPIWAVQASPSWAVDDVSDCPFQGARGAQATQECLVGPAPRAVGEYAAFVAAVARRYPLSAAVEVWNEPNLSIFWRDPDPAAYAALVRATAGAVHAAAPRMRVLAGALARVAPGGPEGVSTSDFLAALMSAGGLSGADALSIHTYPGWPDLRDFSSMVDTTAQALAAAPGVHVVVDELGASTATSAAYAFSPVEQQSTLMTAFRALAWPAPGAPLAGRVDAVLFHTDVDGPGGYGWALPGSPPLLQPVYCAFAKLLRSSALCGVPASLTG